jgi:RNA polymerase sigma factor (sigma-70 family)
MAPRQALTTDEAMQTPRGNEEVRPSSFATMADPLRGRPSALDLFRQGDAATLEQVYWIHIDRVEQIIRQNLLASRVGQRRGFVSSRDVEDLVQDTFARAFSPRARRAYDGERDYWPYLATIARNVLTDTLRARKGDVLVDTSGRLHEHTAQAANDGAHDDLPSPEPRAMAIVKSYLERLPAELAGVHYQRYVLGTSQELAAKALSLTRQRLRTLEGKLRSGLTKELKRAGISTKG